MDGKADTLVKSRCQLGEGPIWEAAGGRVYWNDITAGILHRYELSTGDLRQWSFGRTVSPVIACDGGHLVFGHDTELIRFHPETGERERILTLDPGIPGHRCNDGKSDSRGRLWIGTTHMDHHAGRGTLYVVDRDASATAMLRSVTISNGLAWSADDRTLYFIDSPTQQVRAFDFDPDTGAISFRRVAVQIPAGMGTPDGMTIDEEGMLWVAHWGGFGVHRWDPKDGRLLGKIPVPAPHVTSCCFMGEGLDRLVITTARKGMSAAALAEYPGSGDLFVCTPGVKGRPAPACRL